MGWGNWYSGDDGICKLSSTDMGVGDGVSTDNKCSEAMVLVEMLWQTWW